MQPQLESTGPGTSNLPYRNRVEAARSLFTPLRKYAGNADVIVLALPRGGVPVGYEVAKALGAPLDLMIVRKLGFPGQEELAAGAIATGGVRVLNPAIAGTADQQALDAIEKRELGELQRREQLYRSERPPPDLRGRVVILVDDGLATGATMVAAVKAVRAQHAKQVIVAVPVAPADTIERLGADADEVYCPATPEPFRAIGIWYRDFRQVDDDTVKELLARAWREQRSPREQGEARAVSGPSELEVKVQSGGVQLAGTLSMPQDAQGLVIFAHGSGSSRTSTRNRHVARSLNEARLATLLFDLLTVEEGIEDERTRELRFDIALLTERVVGAVDWAARLGATEALPIGLFGASTGAAAALRAAALRPQTVRAVVSRGGRPDLAGDALPLVRAATLLIVGSRDTQVLALNREASSRMVTTQKLSTVPGATHLFEEPGALDEVARLASEWFALHLGS